MKTQLMSALAAVAALSFAAAAHAADAGVLVSVQKDVRVLLPGGKTRRAGAMQGLPENSRVQVGAGGRAVVVLLKDGSRYALGGGTVSGISSDGLKSISGPAAGRLPSLNLQQAKVLQGSRVAYGRSGSMTVRTGPKLELLTLAGGATTEERPTFKWSTVKDAVSYKLHIQDDTDKVILDREVAGTEFTYPADLPALKAGVEYVWSVKTIVGDKTVTEPGGFNVLSTEQRRALQAELDALKDPAADEDTAALNAVLQAAVYTKYDLLDNAIAIYEQLVAKNPESADLHMALSDLLYWQNRNDSGKEQKILADKLSLETTDVTNDGANVQN